MFVETLYFSSSRRMYIAIPKRGTLEGRNMQLHVKVCSIFTTLPMLHCIPRATSTKQALWDTPKARQSNLLTVLKVASADQFETWPT